MTKLNFKKLGELIERHSNTQLPAARPHEEDSDRLEEAMDDEAIVRATDLVIKDRPYRSPVMVQSGDLFRLVEKIKRDKKTQSFIRSQGRGRHTRTGTLCADHCERRAIGVDARGADRASYSLVDRR